MEERQGAREPEGSAWAGWLESNPGDGLAELGGEAPEHGHEVIEAKPAVELYPHVSACKCVRVCMRVCAMRVCM